MKLLIDLNLAPRWVGVLAGAGHAAVHWSEVGDPRAADAEIMAYARKHGMVLLTVDLDFGNILAASGIDGPSVVQIRADDVRVEAISLHVIRALETCADDLAKGALLSVDASRARVRLLPLRTAN